MDRRTISMLGSNPKAGGKASNLATRRESQKFFRDKEFLSR
jgi:hypothetical protein